ncbi:MAG: hypothetical protein ACR2KX_20645 [Chitinophagaceae bacterium]
MKKSYLFPIILLLLIASCKKPSDFYKELGKGSALILVKQDNALLNAVDATSTVSQVLTFNGEPVESINLYVSATATTDKTKWKLIKNIKLSGETTVAATNREIATALGLTPGALPPGTIYHLYNEAVLKDGRTFSSINTNPGDLENPPAFKTMFHWTATTICPYDATKTPGTYKVTRDTWDGMVGRLVQVTAGPGANQVNLSAVWPAGGAAGFGPSVAPGLLVNVNPTTGAASSGTNGVFGRYIDPPPDPTYLASTTSTGITGFVFSCTGTIDIVVNINTDVYGPQGNKTLTLVKQ